MVRGLGAVVAIAASLALSACSSEVGQVPESSPAVENVGPAFSSKPAAKVALEDAYKKYLARIGQIYRAGGEDATRLKALVSNEKFTRDEAAIEAFSHSGNVVVGSAQIAEFKLQGVDLATGAASAYVCVDVSASKVRDSSGTDVTPSDRPDRQALVVGFLRGPVIDSSESWSGDGVC